MTFSHDCRGILFDKDGTLTDFDATWRQPSIHAAHYLAREAGAPERAEELLRHGGLDPHTGQWQADSLLVAGSIGQLHESWSQLLDMEPDRQHLQGIATIFAAVTARPLIADFAPWLQALRQRGLRLGIATMDDIEPTTRWLLNLRVLSAFDFVAGADSGHGLKPETGMFDAFCRSQGLAPCNVMMIGDSPRDLLMARRAGAGMVVGVLNGSSALEALTPRADMILNSIRELPELLDQLGMS